MSDDVQRLAQVLELVREHRLVVSVLQVGDVRIAIAGRLPAPGPALAAHSGREELLSKEELADRQRERKLEELRRRSKEVFGHVKSDDVLLAMDGAL